MKENKKNIQKNKKKSRVKIYDKPQEVKKSTIAVEKEIIVIEPISVEVEKIEKPKKEKLKEVPAVEDKEKKTAKKITSKKKEE